MGKKLINNSRFIGRVYGSLTVLAEFSQNGKRYFTCQCDCGQIKDASKANILSGNTRSCGCKQRKGLKKFIDETGKRYGKLVLIKRVNIKSRITHWECKCDCGNTVIRSRNYFARKIFIPSCGCERKQRIIKPHQDLTGKKFHKLTVLEAVHDFDDAHKGLWWKCMCECGKIFLALATNLKRQYSCGCERSRHMKDVIKKRFGEREDITGKQFGYFTVEGLDNISHKWKCRCICGNIRYTTRTKLENGLHRSCGCIGQGRPKKKI